MILGLGTTDIKTQRLLLRRFRHSDVKSAYENWSSDERVTRYLRWQNHSTTARTEAVISAWEKLYIDPYYYHWAIVLRETGQVIGGINIDAKDKVDECGELGYSIGSAFWGMGYVSEAVGAVLEFGFVKVGFNRIEGMCAVENRASAKVMQRAGMQYEGCHRRLCRVSNGKFVDCNIYAVLSTDYFEEHGLGFMQPF